MVDVVISENVEETWSVAERLARQCPNKKRGGALVFALIGDLGSGKTTFTQGFANALGVEEKITSPTFVILKRYPLKASCFKNLIHIDAYRLNEGREMEVLGWRDIVSNSDNVILVEWAENIKSVLPDNYVKMTFRYLDEEKRKINISSPVL